MAIQATPGGLRDPQEPAPDQPKQVPAVPPRGHHPGLLSSIEQYVICVLLHLALPLLPVGLELAIVHTVAPDTLYLVAAMYVVTIFMSSRRAVVVVAGVILGMILTAFYGVFAAEKVASAAAAKLGWPPLSPALGTGLTFPTATIAAVFVVHAAERFWRHIKLHETYWDVMRREHQ